MKLLVIDDNQAVRTSLKLVLGGELGTVTAVGDPTLIPVLLQKGEFDAVLLDMNFDSSQLDGRDGLFWLSRIMERDEPPAVILITAFGDITLAVEGMKGGALDFVTKPWDNDELIAKIKSAVEKNQKSRLDRQAIDEAEELRRRDKVQQAMTLDEVKLTHIREVLRRCNGNLSLASERLGINRQTLYNQLKRL